MRRKRDFLKIYQWAYRSYTLPYSLGKDQTIAKVSQLIKGESSFWINKNNLTIEKFSWQDDYFAVSVSEFQVPVVTGYIKNQEKHHSKKSFQDEVNEFMTKYGWSLIKDQV